jgi:hypothetical protein
MASFSILEFLSFFSSFFVPCSIPLSQRLGLIFAGLGLVYVDKKTASGLSHHARMLFHSR